MTIINTDELSREELLDALQMAALEVHYRDRDKYVAACPLAPDNLVGSYFRAPDQDDPNAEAAWLAHEPCDVIEGLVVGQPHATPLISFYLVEFFGKDGAKGHQQVVDLDRMTEQRWLYYDSETWLSMSGTPEGEPAESVKTSASVQQPVKPPPKRRSR